MKRFVLFTVLALLVIGGIVGGVTLTQWGMFLPQHKDNLDLFMESRLAAMEVPGMATGIVNAAGEVSWDGYYGSYDGEHPVSEDTMFMIASVSKTVIATAVMQLWEEGLFELDDDINDYLDFEVRNPNHPEAAITFRHLMTHRASISDRFPFYDDMYTISEGGGDSPWGLGEFLAAYLLPDGQFYSLDNYLKEEPGEVYEYANYGAMLLAYLVEELSGETFADYCQAHIFAPLDMEHSYFLLSDIPVSETEIATPFEDGVALPHYNYPDYPAGSLRTTIRDLARFAAFYLNPSAADAAILKAETIDLMWAANGASDDLGEGEMSLIWTHMDWALFNAIGHTGGDPGVATMLLLYPEEDFATILFLNGDPKNYALMRSVAGRLHAEGLARGE